jgi:hypothetical protein
MPKQKTQPIEFDDLLAQEFHYIAQTAIQANEDRARISSFYLIAVGSLIATIFGTQFFDPDFFSKTVKFMFSGLFTLLTLMGTSTIVQLARLRAAWYESMLAMNQITEFMMSQNKELTKAFRWKNSTLPAIDKKGSISYYQAIEAAVISGLTFGAAAFFFQFALELSNTTNWIVAVIAGIVAMFVQLAIYRRTLR